MENVDLNCYVTKEKFETIPGLPEPQFQGVDVALEYAAGRDTDKSKDLFQLKSMRWLNYSCDSMMAGPMDQVGRVEIEKLTQVTFIVAVNWDVKFAGISWSRKYNSKPITWKKSADEAHWFEDALIER
jgi:hypothetical protein